MAMGNSQVRLFFERNCENSTTQELKKMKTQAKFCSKNQGTRTFSKQSTKINSKIIGEKTGVPYFLAFLSISNFVNLKFLSKVQNSRHFQQKKLKKIPKTQGFLPKLNGLELISPAMFQSGVQKKSLDQAVPLSMDKLP